jgi:pimeloyl-ACP methyl ester carboxylesterase/DNA-binding CsgD family transcriptional regulator
MTHWLQFMSEHHTLVRYDPRGCGLSQTNVDHISFDDWVDDLGAVVDQLKLPSFPLFGMSQGAAVAAEYAIRHPERVSQLILYAPLVTGWHGRNDANSQLWQSMERLVLSGWGEDNMAFPAMFANLFLPESPPETRQWYAELQRKSATKEMAVRFMSVLSELKMFSRLKQITVPTFVVQIAHDQVVDPRSVIGIAGEILGSQFVSVESRNHILLANEPGWEEFKKIFRGQVQSGVPNGSPTPATSASTAITFEALSKREREILEKIAKGFSNQRIADELYISEKTVRNHITSIFDKMGVSTRAQAIVLAKESGF